jgi:hypothetical protein
MDHAIPLAVESTVESLFDRNRSKKRGSAAALTLNGLL